MGGGRGPNRGAGLMWWVFAVAVAIVPGSAVGQHPDSLEQEISNSAREHYERALELYEQEAYARAAEEFRKSYALTAAPMLVYNIALAEWRAGNIEAAKVAALRAKQGDLPPKVRTKIEAHSVGFETLLTSHAMIDATADAPDEQASDRRRESGGEEGGRPGIGRDGGRPVLWSGVALTAFGTGGLVGAWVVERDIQRRARRLDDPAPPDDATILSRIESRQQLGRGLLIGGGVAAVGGITLMVLDLATHPRADRQAGHGRRIRPRVIAGPGIQFAIDF